MKKTISILAAFAVVLNITGCSQNETSEPIVTTTAPIYVQEDEMAYAEYGVLESVTSATDADGNPIETDDTPSASNPSGGTPTNPDGSTHGGGGYNPTYPTNPTIPELVDNVYNTTIEPTIDEADLTLGEVKITLWEDEGGTGSSFILGEPSYGQLRDSFMAKGFVTVEDAYKEIEVQPSAKCKYEFKFEGAGHTVNGEDAEVQTFCLELQKNEEIIPAEDIPKIKVADGYNVDIKAIACFLNEELIGTDEIEIPNLDVDIMFVVERPYEDNASLRVGMDYDYLVSLLGEGVEMIGEENTYYVYKTATYTLVVEHAEYKVGGALDDLVKTLILIKNDPTEEETTETVDTTESEEAEEIQLVPVVDNNIADSVSIQRVTIGEKTMVIGGTLSDILNVTGMSLCPYGTTSLTRDGYTFSSAMYGILQDANDPLSYSGTLVSIEVTDRQGNLVSPSEVDTNTLGLYNVKGVHVDEFFTKDDFEVQFYGGIKVGMKEDEIISILGEGTEIKARTYYRNTYNTLVIEYEGSADGRIVDSITLLVN